MKYIFMNRNDRILDFDYKHEYNAFLGITNIYDLTYAPLILQNSEKDFLSDTFYKWLNDRKIPPLRDNIKYLLDSLKQSDTTDFMISNYGLSLSDQYWFLPENENVLWEDINYFDNTYNSSQFLKASFGLNHIQNVESNEYTTYTPNVSTNGQLSKCWVQQNGKNVLFKGANTIHRFECICEVIASHMCKVLEVPYVSYQCLQLEGSKSTTLVSACTTMIKKNQEFISAYEILQENKNEITHTPQDYHLYLTILDKHHVPNAKEYVEKMFMIDFILANEDRHLGNFGIIRNLDTLKWESVCPVFDTGRSLNTNISKKYWLEEIVDMKFFTNEFVSSEVVNDIFSTPILNSQIEEMYIVADLFEEILIKYIEELSLCIEDIKILKKAFVNRIRLFKKIMIDMCLLID